MKKERDILETGNYDREENHLPEKDDGLYQVEGYPANGATYCISWERAIKDKLKDDEKILEDDRWNDLVEEAPYA